MEVVILGAGNAGKYLYDEIIKKAANKIQVLGFGDNFQHGEYKGGQICKPYVILNNYKSQIDAVFIAAGAQKTIDLMMKTAMSFHITEIYMLHDIAGKCHLSPFDDNGNIIGDRLRKIKFSAEKPTIPYFEVPITDRCNLNCKGCLFGCNRFAQGGDIAYSQIQSDALKIKEFFCDVPWIRILGGEPLLHPELTDILKLYRRVFPEAEIDLCTNGLLIPRMPTDFFEVLKEEHISIHISGYLPIFYMLDSIDNILKSYKLNYVVLKRDYFSKYYTLTANKNMFENYQKCFASGCPELYHGRLLRCSAVLAFEKFNTYFRTKYKLREHEDFIDIHAEGLNSFDIGAWMGHASHICSYCDIDHMEKYHWAYGENVVIDDYIIK